jgi:hypothetical protein
VLKTGDSQFEVGASQLERLMCREVFFGPAAKPLLPQTRSDPFDN